MQTWKTRFRRIAAMVCALALCASLLPAGSLANNTDGIDVDASSSSQVVTGTEPTEEEQSEETASETEQPAEEAETEETVEEETQPTNTDDGTVVTEAPSSAVMSLDMPSTVSAPQAKTSQTLDLTNGTVDIGDIVYTEGGPQTTDVQIYLNYSPLCEFKNLRIDCTGDHTNNFDMQLGEDYYFYEVYDDVIRGVELISSDIQTDADTPLVQTVSIAGDQLTFGHPNVEGHNVIRFYVFNYSLAEAEGMNFDFNRLVNQHDNLDLDSACKELTISFTNDGFATSFVYDDWDKRVFSPKGVDITVSSSAGEGYWLEYVYGADTAAAGQKNQLYTVGSDGSKYAEVTGPAHGQTGWYAFSETFVINYTGNATLPVVTLYYTNGERIPPKVDFRIDYEPNYPEDAVESEPDTATQYYYYLWGTGYGTRLKGNMFAEPSGYKFLGWNTKADGTGTDYAADTRFKGDTVYDSGEDLTLYAQWKKIDQPSEDPHKPTDEELDDLLKGAIKIVCIDNTSHKELLSDLLDQGKPENESYKVDYAEGSTTATVTINRTESYVKAYETAYPGYGEHLYEIEEGVTDVTIELEWENGAWALDGTIPAATITLSCDTTTSTPPSKPDISTLNSLLDVEVTCQNNPNHSKEFAELLDGSYVISTPTMGKENYECTVTITADSYIAQMAGEHKIVGEGSKDVLLAYVNDQWIVANEAEATVSFLAECVAPEAPDNITVAGLLKDVTVTCDEHNSKTYDIADTTITVDKSSLGYDGNNEAFFVKVSVAAQNYVDQYIGDFGPHTLNDTASKTVTLLYQNGSWGLANKDAKVEFKVKCDTPDKPEYDEIAELLGGVTVTCDVHGTGTYKLSDGNYEVGGIQGGGYGALVKVTVFGAAYVDKFEADHNNIAHKLVGSEQITISLVYQKDGWMIDSSDLGKTIAFQVTCKPDAPTTDEVDALKIKDAVTLDCINTSVNHADVTYDLLKDSIITIGEVYGGTGSESYKVDLTIGPAYYVREYDMSMGTTHTWNGSDTGTITLSWDAVNNTWTAEAFDPIVFQVKCSTVTVPGDGGNNNDTPKDEHPDIAEGIANGTWGGTPTPTPAASATSTIPQTSDSMPIGLLAGTAAIAAAAIALLLVLRKRRQQ